MIVELTDHAVIRGVERIGIGRKSLQRMAQNAFERGIHHDRTKGDLRKWIIGAMNAGKGNHWRIWGNNVFVFADASLLTVLTLPKKHRKAVKKLEAEDLEKLHELFSR